MLPDLRLLISATVATFFLAAAAGLYASLRVTQEQIAARAEARAALEDNPITRIANGWPAPEPSRAAALRELARIAVHAPPVVAASEPESTPDRRDADAATAAAQSTTPPADEHPVTASLSEPPVQEITGSTGIAAQPETTTGHPDIHGNIGETAVPEQGKSRAGKNAQPAQKKPQVTVKKVARAAQRRRRPPPPDPRPADQRIIGYPLYLTVPVTN